MQEVLQILVDNLEISEGEYVSEKVCGKWRKKL
jgi:hypothetical protein